MEKQETWLVVLVQDNLLAGALQMVGSSFLNKVFLFGSTSFASSNVCIMSEEGSIVGEYPHSDYIPENMNDGSFTYQDCTRLGGASQVGSGDYFL